MNVNQIKETLSQLGIVPRKSRGQNFLLGDGRASAIANFAAIQRDETVLEIGPGLGAITTYLVDRTERFFLVEKESGFAKYIANKLSGKSSLVEIFQQDVRDLNLNQLETDRLVVVSNVPYSISSEVIIWTVSNRQYIARASYLLQKEFAERIAASPGTKAYGSLSVLAEIFFTRALGDIIKGNEFYPAADVESRLVKLTRRDKPLVEISDLSFFEQIVRSCFAMRRKTVANNLIHGGSYPNRREAESSLESLKIDPRARAETLDVFQFARLVNSLQK